MKTMPNSTVVYPAAFLLWIATLGAAVAEGRIVHDRARKSITMADGSGGLMLRLNYDGRCMLDRVVVRGADVVCSNTGVYSAIRIGGAEYSTRSAIPSPKVDVSGDTVTASGIRFGGSGVEADETWFFMLLPDGITWRTDPAWLPDETRQKFPRGYYNTGLAHGVPGVIALLGLACAAGVEEKGTGPICRDGPRPTSGRCPASRKQAASPFPTRSRSRS